MHYMISIEMNDSNAGSVEKSLRSPILLQAINIDAALSAYEFCGFDGCSFGVSDPKSVSVETAGHGNPSVNGEVAGTCTGVVASSAKENALVALAALCVLSSASVLRGVFDSISSRR
jgi:hypothetical protein